MSESNHTDPSQSDISRVEAWLLSHEEWPAPNDDLRAKVMRTASSVQAQALDNRQSRFVVAWCVTCCLAVTWMLQDVAHGIEDPQSSALVAIADEGWLRPVDQQVTYLMTHSSRISYDWALVHAHISWRKGIHQRLTDAMWQ